VLMSALIWSCQYSAWVVWVSINKERGHWRMQKSETMNGLLQVSSGLAGSGLGGCVHDTKFDSAGKVTGLVSIA